MGCCWSSVRTVGDHAQEIGRTAAKKAVTVIHRCGHLNRAKQYDYSNVAYEYAVGIDLGAAYTGYAFDRLDAVDCDENGPGHHSLGEPVQALPYFRECPAEADRPPKTLSVILYRRSKAGWRAVAWGMRAYDMFKQVPTAHEADHHFIDDIKMALSSEQAMRRFEEGRPADSGLTLQRVLTDLLRMVKEHVLQRGLKEGYGLQEAVVAEEVKWCITVPAVWPNSGSEMMRRAAEGAGMIKETGDPEHLTIVIEPEAAALTAKEDGILGLVQGDMLLVIDAGGGTTDITMHEVLEGRLLSEALVVRGIEKGSRKIDQSFIAYLRQKFSDEVINKFQSQHLSEYNDMLYVNWQRRKELFSGVGSAASYVQLPGGLYSMLSPTQIASLRQEQPDAGDNDLLLTADAVRGFFDEVVPHIIAEVAAAVSDTRTRIGRVPNKMVLVGGLGSSLYLKQQVQQLVQREGWGSAVIRPENGNVAVVYGAVYALKSPKMLIRRRSLKSYGICQRQAPDSDGRPDQDLITLSDLTGSEQSWGLPTVGPDGHVFIPFIRQDSEVEVGQVVKKSITFPGNNPFATIPIYSVDHRAPGGAEERTQVAILRVNLKKTKQEVARKEPRQIQLQFKVGRKQIMVCAINWKDHSVSTQIDFEYEHVWQGLDHGFQVV